MSMHSARYPGQHHARWSASELPLMRYAAWMVLFVALSAAIVLWGLQLTSSQLNATSTESIGQAPAVVLNASVTGAARERTCSADFYLTGDLIADANPAAVLASICGPR